MNKREAHPEMGPLSKIQAELPFETHAETHPIPASQTFPKLIELVQLLTLELFEQKQKIKTLNPSRRLQLTQYLETLVKPQANLQKTELQFWLEVPISSPEGLALKQYFQELSVLYLCQAILLKRWSDLGFRIFQKKHLHQLNFEFVNALQPLTPIHLEGWSFTKPSLYTWYTPSQELQEEIYQVLEILPLSDTDVSFLMETKKLSLSKANETLESLGYDQRFFEGCSNYLNSKLSQSFKLHPETKTQAYTPTLRDGRWLRAFGGSTEWIGFEKESTSLAFLELCELWNGPKSPPLWAQGLGLESQSTQEMSLPGLSSAKLSTIQSITERESCHLAFIIEEKKLTTQDKSCKSSQAYKAKLELYPKIKSLKSQNTSLGVLQACVALSKLRPEGLLLWSRERCLDSEEGQDALHYLLAKSKLLAEIDFSGIEHHLPIATPLYPRVLYLFSRECDLESRLNHRPKRIQVTGTLKSHIELPQLLESCFGMIEINESFIQIKKSSLQFSVQQSPLTQKEWMKRWPDLSTLQSYDELETLLQNSVQLGELATVKSFDSQMLLTKNRPFSEEHTLWLHLDTPHEESQTLPELKVYHSQQFRETQDQLLTLAKQKNIFLLVFRSKEVLSVIRQYLSKKVIKTWLALHLDKKNEHFILKENQIKLIPIPKDFLKLSEQGLASSADDVSPESLSFWKNAQILEDTLAQKNRLLPFLKSNSSEVYEIDWCKLQSLLSNQEGLRLTQHPMVKIRGQIPLHKTLKVEKLNTKEYSLLLIPTDSSEVHQIVFEHKLLMEIAFESIQSLKHPNWAEILQAVTLPQNIEVLSTTAQDLLNTAQELDHKITKLKKTINENESHGSRKITP